MECEKADVVECPETFHHVGLLADKPPASPAALQFVVRQIHHSIDLHRIAGNCNSKGNRVSVRILPTTMLLTVRLMEFIIVPASPLLVIEQSGPGYDSLSVRSSQREAFFADRSREHP
jgi:hypothetical protein